MHVLIADDDKTLNLLLSTQFRERGWTVTIALDAMQVVMHAMRSKPDAIILDIQMPGGTGVEALKKLKASTKTARIPVLVLSGSIESVEGDKLLALGAALFLAKPADPEAVFKAVARLAELSATQG
jgi:CheY-like chemotaxis protein